MRFPDTITILRPSGEDEYGNADGSWSFPEEIPAVGFVVSPTLCLMPAGTDVRRGDRLQVSGRLYAVDGDPSVLRSPSRDVMTQVALTYVRS